MKHLNLLVFCLFLMVQTLTAQNARLSQVGSAPMQFNPALTGRFDGMVRMNSLYGHHRSNISVMQHQYVGADIKLGKYRNNGDDEPPTSNPNAKPTPEGKDKLKPGKAGGYWAAGLSYYHYGDPKSPLKASFYSASVARHFYNKSNKYFGFGVQATYAEGTLNENNGINYDWEISGGGFHYPKQGSINQNKVGNNNYVDFNAGGYYGMVTDAVAFELGGAMYHLFYPRNDVRGQDDETKLRHRITAYSTLRLRLNDKWGIVQKNMYWQEGMFIRSTTPKDTNDRQIVAFWSGLDFVKVNPLKKYNINFGMYTRSFRTIMPVINANLGHWGALRYSYEHPLNSKKFTAYTAKRHEVALSLTYKRYTSPGVKFYKKINFW